MAKDTDLKKVLILGSGPIVIGQACEFDYSGTQACKALMREGLQVVLVNSNPATIMTDPDLATATYIEPLTAPFVEKIIERERPDALIPTMGGQTALNLALELDRLGVLKRYEVRMLGASPEIIKRAEDRDRFRQILDSVGAQYPASYMVRSFEDGKRVAADIGLPIILRPNYTLGGGGGGIAYTIEEFEIMLSKALRESPTSEVLVEESILGWKEFELEVMRDRYGTFVIICSIENIDPCGVHTGDSITVAPQQTLSDRAYQEMRDEARRITEAVGLECGGANIQFAVHPKTGQRVVIEMNPRVSRSSALASKATGFPIAKISALLAIGYGLDEIRNDITRTTPSAYEPALDYVVTKIPRFAFEKFPGTPDLLTTQMKSVGEVMGIGRTFKESFHKAFLSLEKKDERLPELGFSEAKLAYPNSERLYHIIQAFRDGYSIAEVQSLTQIDPWFLEQFEELVQFEQKIRSTELTVELVWQAKRHGFSDLAIAHLRSCRGNAIKQFRVTHNIRPAFLRVDTCAGEFASETPYFYSTYWADFNHYEYIKKDNSVAILGSGPNRIGQGIEFDYSCVRGVKRLQKEGLRVVMINSNPETVSTDYDTSDELYFEPLTAECVSEVFYHTAITGFIAQLGGQTPINLSSKLVNEGFQLLGSPVESIDLAEDRTRFAQVCRDLDLRIPASGTAGSVSEARTVAEKIGYPIICRPSYVLGGRQMEVLEDDSDLVAYFDRYGKHIKKESPCFMDQFLEGALEVDVDLVRGVDWTVIGGVLEHIEAVGIHSGDSMGVIPPQRLRPQTCFGVEKVSLQLAERLGAIGHLNIQMAIKDNQIYVLEANPRSSRSVPFISKATGIPIVDLGILAMLGRTAWNVKPEQYRWLEVPDVSVKGVVFPFKKFPESDSILGPEMKSTGESMGRGDDYAEALLKASIASNLRIPDKGEIFLSLREKDKVPLLALVRRLVDWGYQISATSGTAAFFESKGLACTVLKKVHEGRPHCVDRIRSGRVGLVINTTSGRKSIEASFDIRRSCIDFSVPCITETHAAEALIQALMQNRNKEFTVTPIPKMI